MRTIEWQAFELFQWPDGTSLRVYRGPYGPEAEAFALAEVKSWFEEFKALHGKTGSNDEPFDIVGKSWVYRHAPREGEACFSELTSAPR